MSDQITESLWTSGISGTPTVLIGVDPATLTQWLSDAQAAYALMMTGGKPQTVTYGTGDGMKSVTFSRGTNAGQLLGWIQQLQQALGLGRGRRPIRVAFSR